jgi:hypothetical protein
MNVPCKYYTEKSGSLEIGFRIHGIFGIKPGQLAGFSGLALINSDSLAKRFCS